MPAHKLVNDEQMRLLISLVEEYREQILTNSNNTASRRKLISLWNQIALRLNSVPNGVIKSPNKWREYWSEKKYIARKKDKELSSTEPSKYGVLTPLEVRILNIIERANKEKKEDLKIRKNHLKKSKRSSKHKKQTVSEETFSSSALEVSKENSYYLSDYEDPITFVIEKSPDASETEAESARMPIENSIPMNNYMRNSPTHSSTNAMQEMSSAMRDVAKEMNGLRRAIERISNILESRLPPL